MRHKSHIQNTPRKKDTMFLIMGTFAIVFLMLIIGFIGEIIGGMFAQKEEGAEGIEESFSEYATAR